MSDSLDNNVDAQNEVTQPVDAVVANAEEISSPQTDHEETELYVEAEGDQETAPNDNANPSEAELHARWVKEKEKRKRKNEELQLAETERKRLEDELNELKSTVGKLTKGKPPTLESCDYDEAAYQQQVKDYYSQPEAKQPEVKQEQAQQHNPEMERAEFYLYQKEQELTKKLPGYDKEKSELLDKMKQYGGNEQTMIYLANIAKQAGVDIAKANVAMNKNPNLLFELNSAAQTNNQFAIADVLKKAAGKVQTRQRKPIDTQPEPDIKSSGPIDNAAKAIESAKAKWMESGSVADYNAYKQLKKTATK